ncbi:4-hydroxybenzoate 3-monooxygenase [Actinoplanes sp. NPDC049596]|uniref:4-hydroxybenzoate 3-monooxygenase n=1 Tax=unclassified Actinoplanes TaxID=2626549 RepID=UPI003430D38A
MNIVIIGAGVAGLTLGNFLRRNGIDCVILEKRSRAYVEQRQRAGTIDSRGVRMYRDWGLEEVVEKGLSTEEASGFWIDGEEMPVDFEGDDNSDSVFCPQQVLVRNLTEVFLREGGDLRYEVDDIALGDSVRYGSTVLECDYIAGCDGDRGISRAAIPDGVLTRYTHEYGYSWLSVLAEVPPNPSGMAIHSRGLAGLIPRGAAFSRAYLQCDVGDTPADWPDTRVWSELQARFGTPVSTGPIVEKTIVPLRNAVHEPMQHGKIFLLGDAAHIVPPMSAKGIHLALHDAEVLAQALIRKYQNNDESLLDSYSETCLSHIWNYQAFATWITEIMHNAGNPSHEGEFRRRTARAELQRQFTSPAASRLFGELTAGVN